MSDQSQTPAIPAIAPGKTAVVTGAAGGIGLAAARRLAKAGMNVVLIDREAQSLDSARLALLADGASEDTLRFSACDVSDAGQLSSLAKSVADSFGPVSLLMNNAGIGANPGTPWENAAGWHDLIDVNFWGVVNGVQAFAPDMVASGEPGLIVNTGSKQGITTPPGNLAYNVSKAAVKSYTEGLAHALRNTEGARVSAHLLIPGFTFTGMTARSAEKPAGAWTPDQVVDFMLAGLGRRDFYILCPDNETERATDEKRMAWAVGDIIENRPALSRWHPDHAQAFADFMKR